MATFMAAQVAWSIFNTFRESYMSVFQICDLLSEISLSVSDAATGRRWNGDKWKLVQCRDGCGQGVEGESCRMKSTTLGHLFHQDERRNYWSSQSCGPRCPGLSRRGYRLIPEGRLSLGGALGTNNLLFVQTRTSSTMRVVLCCPLLLFSLVLSAAHSKIFFNFAFNPFFFLTNVRHPELLISIYFQFNSFDWLGMSCLLNNYTTNPFLNCCPFS